jgi:subtilisin family serine protease
MPGDDPSRESQKDGLAWVLSSDEGALSKAAASLEASGKGTVEAFKGLLRVTAPDEVLCEIAKHPLLEVEKVETPHPPERGAEPPASGVIRRSKRTDPKLGSILAHLERSLEPQQWQEGVASEIGKTQIQRNVRAPSATEAQCFRIRFHAPMDAALRRTLYELRVKIANYRKGWYQAYLTPKQEDAVRRLPDVAEVRLYDLEDTVSTTLLVKLEKRSEGQLPTADYEAIAHRAEDVPDVERLLRGIAGVEILDVSRIAVRFRLQATEPVIAYIASLREIAMLTPYAVPNLYCDVVRSLIGVELAQSSPDGSGLDGHGEVIGIFDSGLDVTHPDFQAVGRAVITAGFDGLGSSDLVGHGTHVAGIAAGSGEASNGKLAGIAPAAGLVCINVTDIQGDRPALHLPADLGVLFTEAYERNARLMNCSWGNRISGVYDSASYTADAFVHEHPDALVVVAAGNEGSAPTGERVFNNLGSPASAKNVLTVGACGSSRTGFQLTAGQFTPSAFKKDPTKREELAPNSERASPFSSVGPTDYDGAKPDMVAPGTFILAPRATNLFPTLKSVDEPSHGGRYVYMHGSSMAAPVVTGAAALLRQYLRQRRACPKPSAALLKALLILATEPLPEITRSNAPSIGYPDFDHGYGRLNLKRLWPDAAIGKDFAFDDVANDSQSALVSGASSDSIYASVHRYTFEIPPDVSGPLEIALVWTDVPGSGLVNDLQLYVQQPDGSRRFGNDGLNYPARLPNAPPNEPELTVIDTHNPVEVIRLTETPSGIWKLRVWARNTPLPDVPQGFALAISGTFTNLKRI